MKMQILAALALVVSGLSSSAHASHYLALVECHSVDSGPDHGIQVHISKFFGPPAVGSIASNTLTATILEETIAGQQELGSFSVLEKQSPAMGAPKVYRGRDFNLAMEVDGTPVPGGFPSTLTAEVNGQRISEELLCNFVR